MQFATHKSVSTSNIVLICALQFANLLRLYLSPEQLHTQSPFLNPIAFSINLMPFFEIGSVQAVLCSGMHMRLFTWTAARSQLSRFGALAAGHSCFTAVCYVNSPNSVTSSIEIWQTWRVMNLRSTPLVALSGVHQSSAPR